MIKPIGWAKSAPQSAVPYVIGKEGKRFNFTFWNRLNAKLDRAREQGMGAYIMLYSDDEQTPDHFGITPRSKQERRLFRYVVARLAAYPNVLWDSGIDIGEYRSKKWIDWYAQWFRQHDPWQHPVGSRTGGGSGGTMPPAATYYSLGDVSLPSRADLLGELKRPVPVAHTDHWRPFIKRGHWTNEKLRIAAWRCALSGFQAFYADYHAGFNEHAKTKKGAKYIGYVTRFFKNLVGADNDDAKMRQGAKYIGYATHFFKDLVQSDLRNLRPHDELLAGGDNVLVAANPGHEYMLYFENGGPARLNLSGPSHTFNVLWYNPRTGEKHREQAIKSGKPAQFIPPTQGKDWVFLLQRHGK